MKGFGTVGAPSGAIELERDGAHTRHYPAPAQWGITQSLAADPDAKTKPTRWFKCLREWTGGDKKVIAYIQRVFGYCLTGLAEERKLFLWHGPTATGKSVCVETMLHCLGTYAVSAPMDTFLARKQTEHLTELARLEGKRLVIANEAARGRTWNAARVKEITGGTTIAARYMRQDYFEFTPQFKLAIASNDPPNLKGKDPAMIARLDILPFQHAVAEDQQNKSLTENLKGEAGAIINWGLEGFTQWRELGGLRPPPAVVSATKQYLEDQDLITQWINERCELGAQHHLPWGAAYEDYKEWVDKARERALTKRQFMRDLRQAGHFEAGKENDIRGLFGLRLAHL